jgi:PEP-utilising enzyme, mobile domain/Pyruvate phosphate dikinase, AMP/ATP-binding domain
VIAPISLADPAALDPTIVGEKAAALSRALASRLPALPGVALPLEGSTAAIRSGIEALERGPSSAYLAATATTVAPILEEVVRFATSLAGSVVVRSSTAMDADGRWAGAFTSYLDIDAFEVPAAVRGCWASVFSRDVLARCDATDTDVRELRVGALIQPFVRFDTGGTARLLDDGRIDVAMSPGGPSGVVRGSRRAVGYSIGSEGRYEGPDHSGVGDLLDSIGDLVRRVAEVTGVGSIEWGSDRGEVILLQVAPSTPSISTSPISRMSPGEVPAATERIALLVTRFPGPLGEELVVPWGLAGNAPEGGEPLKEIDPREALTEARSLADELSAAAWNRRPEAARAGAAAASRLLRSGHLVEAVELIEDLRPVDGEPAQRVIGLIAGIGTTLTRRGVLPSADVIWRLSRDDLTSALDGRAPRLRRGPGRWEPFVVGVVTARGSSAIGLPVAPGIGAGPLHRLSELRAIGRPGPRDVLLVPLPLPQLAPLLWHCAGLVTAGGSTGAHLFEVARSLGVPAVCGMDVSRIGHEGSLAVVDGGAGRTSFLPHGGATPTDTSLGDRSYGSLATA